MEFIILFYFFFKWAPGHRQVDRPLPPPLCSITAPSKKRHKITTNRLFGFFFFSLTSLSHHVCLSCIESEFKQRLWTIWPLTSCVACGALGPFSNSSMTQTDRHFSRRLIYLCHLIAVNALFISCGCSCNLLAKIKQWTFGNSGLTWRKECIYCSWMLPCI